MLTKYMFGSRHVCFVQVQQAGANLLAVVPQAPDERTFGIGVNSPSFADTHKNGEGTAPIFALAAAGFASIITRNGSPGLSPATGGWDSNSDGSAPSRGRRGGKSSVAQVRTTPNGVEKVRFPVDGGPGRSAAGQQGVGLLLAGVLPTFVEISRVMGLEQMS